MNKSPTPTNKLDPLNPMAGDIISFRYRWHDKDHNATGEKIRPCLIVKAAADGSSFIAVPISTKEGWKAVDCIEIPPDDRAEAGVHSEKRSWVKITEFNKVDLPNLAVIPHHDKNGQMSWRRGRASDALMKQVTSEIAQRVHDKTLKGMVIKADQMAHLQLAAIRKIEPTVPPEQDASASSNSEPVWKDEVKKRAHAAHTAKSQHQKLPLQNNIAR